MEKSNARERAIERVRAHFQGDANQCWEWKGARNPKGYGRIIGSDNGKVRQWFAHRLAWEATHGPIPDGLTIDHVCHNTSCFNPAHLRLLTRSENACDNGRSAKTHCPAGHAYDDANTYRGTSRGYASRICRKCRVISNRAYRQKVVA